MHEARVRQAARGLAVRSNESTDGPPRQYLPERIDLHATSAEQLDDVAAELDERPRQTPDSQSPSEALTAALR